MSSDISITHRANPWSGQRRDVVAALRTWHEQGLRSVLATVVSTDSSAPRGIGAQLAIREDGFWVGGLSGGCAETEVLLQARELLTSTLKNEHSSALIHLTRDELSAAGPICGATLGILVEVVDEELIDLWMRIQKIAVDGGTALVHRTWKSHGRGTIREAQAERTHHEPHVDHALVAQSMSVTHSVDSGRDDATIVLATTSPGRLQLTECILPAPKLLICGGGDIAVELILLAQRMGWRTCLNDPRSSWVDATVSIALPDMVIAQWPSTTTLIPQIDANTACIACAHDGKLDLPFLEVALNAAAFYVGSVGSRATQAERNAHLTELVGAKLTARHHGPAGLRIADNTASGIALSVVAEVSQQMLSQ